MRLDPAGGSTAGVPKAGCPVQIRAGRGMYFGLGAGGVGGRRDSRRRDGIALGRGRAAQRGYFPVYRPCDAERQYALNVQIRRGKRAHVANRSASRSGRRTRRPRDCSAPKRRLDGSKPTPVGCPSRASIAGLIGLAFHKNLHRQRPVAPPSFQRISPACHSLTKGRFLDTAPARMAFQGGPFPLSARGEEPLAELSGICLLYTSRCV